MNIPHLFSESRSGSGWRLVVLIIYSSLLLIGLSHHELWLDEAHHFLLASDSNSISELLKNMRYDGHPMGWNLLLFIITRISENPFLMQLLNASLMAVAAILLLWRAPFSLLFKVMLLFGYFMSYEYGIISRNYSLVIMLLFLTASLYPFRNERSILFGIALALLANTHLFATITVMILLLLWVWQLWPLQKANSFQLQKNLAFVIVLIGIFLAFSQCLHANESFLATQFHEPWLSTKRIGKAVAVPFKAIFHLPDFLSYRCWNSNFFLVYSRKIAIVVFPLSMVLPFFLLYKKPFTLFFFYASAILVLVFIFISPMIVSIRHCGFIWLLLVAALWISQYESESRWLAGFPRMQGWLNFFSRPAIAVWWLALTLQMVSAVILWTKDFQQPFSESKAVSEFLTEEKLEKEFIIVSNQAAGPPVSAYLKRSLFHLEAGKEASFCLLNTIPFLISDSATIAKVAAEIPRHSSLILLLNHEIPGIENRLRQQSLKPTVNIHLIQKFRNSLVQAENYWVYRINS